MFRIALAVAAGVACAAQAEVIEYRLWGAGSFYWNSTDPITAPAQSSWIQQSGYDMRFVANTDNIVADGLGGYSVAIDFAEMSLGDEPVMRMAPMSFHVDADGKLSFVSTRHSMAWMTITAEVFRGYGLATDIEPQYHQIGVPGDGTASNWWQFASYAHFEFLSTGGGRGYGLLDELNFSATRGVPTPGSVALMGLAGLAAARRRR